MRILLGTLLASVVLAALAAIPAGAATTHTCKSIATQAGTSGPVHATGVTCATARAVARTFGTTGKAKKGWTCSAKPYQGGATATCRRGSGATQERVRFQIGD
jgi:hypothetical protein